MVQQISTKIIPEIIQYPIYTFKSIMENAEPPLNNFMKSFSFKPEIFQKYVFILIVRNEPINNGNNVLIMFVQQLSIWR